MTFVLDKLSSNKYNNVWKCVTALNIVSCN